MNERDKAATLASKQQRAAILNKIRGLGVEIPRPSFWKVSQLQAIYEILSPIIRAKKRAEVELTALKAMEAAQNPQLLRWPAAGTDMRTQANVATRLQALSKVTGSSMSDLLSKCRSVAANYSLGVYGALAAVESMCGVTWDREGQEYLVQVTLGDG